MKFGILGVTTGAVALLLALVHFWAGPFAPQPTLETSIAAKAASIRKATLDALKGKEPVKEQSLPLWDADKITHVVTAVLGGLALVLAVVALIQREPLRVAVGSAALGFSAIAFQFIAMYAMAVLFVWLVTAALSSINLDDLW